ncbi:uncharacterized protein LOC118819315 [Colossoma macropomum]|uniref:uncharacterized protein LOC118819315 n=1 Tax=Colossoma macropomum TaxID=42526 RepID=UPI001864E2D7|nr:uncharacterized protein LOC118819315 [Colossoma macropomum]
MSRTSFPEHSSAPTLSETSPVVENTQNQHLVAKQAIENRRQRMAAREEPSRGLLLKFKYPNGFICMRKFTEPVSEPVSEPIQVLFDFVGQDEMASEIFSVQEATSSTPIESTSSGSLMDHGINTSATLNIQEMITDKPNNGVFDHPLPSAQAPPDLPSVQALLTLPSAQMPPALPSALASPTQPSAQALPILLSSQTPAILPSIQALSNPPSSQPPLIPASGPLALPSDQAPQVIIIDDWSPTFPSIEPPTVILEDQEQLCLSPPQYYFNLSTMASAQEQALQALSSELAQLDRQITALLKNPTWSLEMAAPQRALQTLTATPADIHLLQLFRCPQFTAFTYASGLLATHLSAPDLVTHPRTSLPSALIGRNSFGTVVIHVGTNDISDRRSEVLKEHYQTLLDTARKKTGIVISGPLPTYRRGSERFSRLFALQSWLCDCCALNGLGYVDNWSSFWERAALYWRDGLHPSRLGSGVLSRNIERAIH